ncbi:hypothetical protein [Mycobacterium intracellulare]|uniref:hypothetical protein n=1 Tax=Mycobacterium intracellulare TaxID=1767 RepID=UPI0011AB5515|nr:hypothetical protein [Mycobacterium intracellulare]UCN12785.1 hypothetical protein LFT50_28080 [Mycobacterium intracellulare subsp. chimaera]
MFGLQGRRIVVPTPPPRRRADLRDDSVSAICSFGARLSGLESVRRRTDQVFAALEASPKRGVGRA